MNWENEKEVLNSITSIEVISNDATVEQILHDPKAKHDVHYLISNLTQLADKDNAEAAYQAASLLEEQSQNVGYKKFLKEALAYMEIAARHFYKDSQKQLNRLKKLEKISQASNENEPDAHDLNELYEQTKKLVAAKPEIAFLKFTNLANNNHPQSQYELGVMYETGVGGEQNFKLALEMLLKAASNKYIPAYSRLGQFYYDGQGTEKNVSEAYRWFALAAEAGDNNALYELGLLYLKGEGVEKDEDKGLALIRQAAALGNSDAEVHLVQFYMNTGDSQEAIRRLHIAADKQNLKALEMLGELYEQGNILARDINRSQHWFERAAQLGSSLAISRLNRLQRQGLVITEYSPEIKELLDKSNTAYSKGRYNRAYEFSKKAALLGSSEGMFIAGLISRSPGRHCEDAVKSHNYMQKAKDMGHIEAEIYCAKDLVEGFGVKQDIIEGLQMLERLASTGHLPMACDELFSYYYESAFVNLKPDHLKAFRYASQGAELGSPYSTKSLGLLYYRGHGVQRNLHKAYDLLKKAEEMGEAEAGKELYEVRLELEKAHLKTQDSSSSLEEIETVIFPEFDLDLINSNINLHEITAKLKPRQSSFMMLIIGSHGTGKKEYVKYLAKELGYEVYQQNIIDMMEKVLGADSLTNVVGVFEQARINKSMILFYGFEYLLGIAEDDLLHNIEIRQLVAKIIQCAKKYKYPVVFALYNDKYLDKEITDAFDIIMKFDFLNKSQKTKAYTKFFGLIPSIELAHVGNLVCNDFRQVKKKLFILGEDTNQEKILAYLKERAKALSSEIDAEFSENYNTDLISADIDIEDFINKLAVTTVKDFSIIIHGPPGTGKTEFLKYLAYRLGFEVIYKRLSDLNSSHHHETEKLMAIAFKEARERKAFLIIDDIENLLTSKYMPEQRVIHVPEANELLSYMQSHKYPLGCTTNNIDRLDRAAIKKFIFKIKFDYMSKEQLLMAYNTFFNHEAPTEILDLGGLTPSDFYIAKKKAAIFNKLDDDKEILELIKCEVKAKSKSNIIHFQKNQVQFDLSLVNTDIDLADLVEKLSRPGAKRNFSLLTYGPSGTGKAMFLRYLASKIGIEVVVKRCSELMSTWHENSEKSITEAFHEAADRKAFLIIDDADDLLLARENSINIGHKLRVPEFLRIMDAHEYPFACTINSIDRIDQATYHRFLLMVKMDYLKPQQIKKAFQDFFGFEAPDNIAGFARITPAILSNALKKAQFFDVISDQGKTIKIVEDEIKLAGYKETNVIVSKTDEISIKKLPLYIKPLYEHASEVLAAAVMIKQNDNHGSGFIISQDGYILTNTHVVKDSKFAIVKLATGRELPAEVISLHKNRDVAVLKVNGDINLPPVPLRLEELAISAPVFAIGSPLEQDLFNTISKGIVSGYRKQIVDEESLIDLQHDCATHKGSSGGMIIDGFGNAVAVHYAGFRNDGHFAAGLGFSVPIADALKHLNIIIK